MTVVPVLKGAPSSAVVLLSSTLYSIRATPDRASEAENVRVTGWSKTPAAGLTETVGTVLSSLTTAVLAVSALPCRSVERYCTVVAPSVETTTDVPSIQSPAPTLYSV